MTAHRQQSQPLWWWRLGGDRCRLGGRDTDAPLRHSRGPIPRPQRRCKRSTKRVCGRISSVLDRRRPNRECHPETILTQRARRSRLRRKASSRIGKPRQHAITQRRVERLTLDDHGPLSQRLTQPHPRLIDRRTPPNRRANHRQKPPSFRPSPRQGGAATPTVGAPQPAADHRNE